MAMAVFTILLLSLCASPACCRAVGRVLPLRRLEELPVKRFPLGLAALTALGLGLRLAAALCVPAELSPGEAALVVAGRRFLADGMPVLGAEGGALTALLVRPADALFRGNVRALRALSLLAGGATVPLAALALRGPQRPCAAQEEKHREHPALGLLAAALFALSPWLIQASATLSSLSFVFCLLAAGACAFMYGRPLAGAALIGLAAWGLPGAWLCALPLGCVLALCAAPRRRAAPLALCALLCLPPALCFVRAALYLPAARFLCFTLPELSLSGVEAAWLQGVDGLRPALIERLDALLSWEIFRHADAAAAEGAAMHGMGAMLLALVPVTLAGCFACLGGAKRGVVLWAALTAAGLCLFGAPDERHLLLLSLPLLCACAVGAWRVGHRMRAAAVAIVLTASFACGSFMAAWAGADHRLTLQKAHMPGIADALRAAAQTDAERIVITDCFDLWESPERAALSLAEAALGQADARMEVEYLDGEELEPDAVYILTLAQAEALGATPAASYGGFAVVDRRTE